MLNTKGGDTNLGRNDKKADHSGGSASTAFSPAFMQELSIDHPEIAAKVAKDIPRWCLEINTLAGHEGVGQAMLRGARYFSKREQDLYLQGVANEATSLLRQNRRKEVVFVNLEGSGSGAYFFDLCMQRVPEELRSRVELKPITSVVYQQDRKAKRDVEYFALDDSANSGQQLQQLLGGMIRFAEHGHPPARRWGWPSPPKPIKFHLRMMAVTSHAEESQFDPVARRIKGKEGVISLDAKYEKMPLMREVFAEAGISLGSLSADALAGLRTVLPPAILGFFFHRMQDNLPYLFSAPSVGLTHLPLPLFRPGQRIEKAYGKPE